MRTEQDAPPLPKFAPPAVPRFGDQPPPPVPAHLRAMYNRVVQSGIYTPGVAKYFSQLPINYSQTAPSYYMGFYNTSFGNFHPGVTVTPGSNEDAIRHELGHAMDFSSHYTPSASERLFRSDSVLGGLERQPNQFIREVENYQQTHQHQPNPFPNSDHPGMFGNPYATLPDGRQWGGPTELYARMAENPSGIPTELRHFFPQYTPNAYQVPGGSGGGLSPELGQSLAANHVMSDVYRGLASAPYKDSPFPFDSISDAQLQSLRRSGDPSVWSPSLNPQGFNMPPGQYPGYQGNRPWMTAGAQQREHPEAAPYGSFYQTHHYPDGSEERILRNNLTEPLHVHWGS